MTMLHAILAVFVASTLRVSAFQQQRSIVSLHHPSCTSFAHNKNVKLLPLLLTTADANASADDKPTNSGSDIAKDRRRSFWKSFPLSSLTFLNVSLVVSAGYTVLCLIASAAAGSGAAATAISPFFADPAVGMLATIGLGFYGMMKDFKGDFAEKLDKHESQIAVNIKDLEGDLKDLKGDLKDLIGDLKGDVKDLKRDLKDLKGDMTKITANMSKHEIATAVNMYKLETKLNEQERSFAEKLGKQKRSLARNIKRLKGHLGKRLDSLENNVAAIKKSE